MNSSSLESELVRDDLITPGAQTEEVANSEVVAPKVVGPEVVGPSNALNKPQESPAEPATSEKLDDSSAKARRRRFNRPRYPDRVNGRIGRPESRKHGNLDYVGQLLRTSLPLALADLGVLLVCIVISAVLGLKWWPAGVEDVWQIVLLWVPPTAISLLLINTAVGLYPGTRIGAVEEIRRLLVSYTIVFIMTGMRLRLSSVLWYDRALFVAATFLMCIILAPLVRSRVRRILSKSDSWGFPTLVCGNDAAVFGVCQWLSNNRRLGLRPLGVIADPKELELDKETPWHIGSWDDAREIAERENAYWAVLVESNDENYDVTSTVENHLGIVPHVFVVSELTGMPDHWDRHQMDEGLSGFLIEQHLLLPVQQIVKRGMDLTIATLTGVLLMPLFLVLAILIKLTSRGPVFFGHARVGYDNTRFKAWKFRTMVAGAEKDIEEYLHDHPDLRLEWERDHKLKNDPRVTALGRFMRKWSIDELPQIWNVFCGEMSIVGPRPIVENEIEKYGEHFETFCTVLPGITGLWQVCGRNDTSFEDRIQLGVYYILHWSPWLDLYLLAKTVRVVLFTKGAY